VWLSQGVRGRDFQAGLAYLLRAGSADPFHNARHGRGVFVQDELDGLSSFEAGGSRYPETAERAIKDEAWNPLRLQPMPHDETRRFLQGGALGAQMFGVGPGGHGFSRH